MMEALENVEEFYKKLIKKESEMMFEGNWSKVAYLIYEKIPAFLEKDATAEMWQEYADFCYMLKRLSFFLFCKELRGKKIIAFGGLPGCGKSTLLRAVIGRGANGEREELKLPPSLPAYIVKGENLTFWGLNNFGSWGEYTEKEIAIIRDGMPSGSGIEKMDHLLNELIVITPQVNLSNVMIMDLPRHEESGIYGSRGKATIKTIHSHLSNSDIVFWVVAAGKGGLVAEELEFLKQIDHDVQIFVVLTKVDDMAPYDVELAKKKIIGTLLKNEIRYSDVFSFRRAGSDLVAVQPIREALNRINNAGAGSSVSFLREFHRFFAVCNDYYEQKARISKDSLVKMGKSVMHTSNADTAMNEIEDVIRSFRSEIKQSLEAKQLVSELEQEFFVEMMFLVGDGSFDDFKKTSSDTLRDIDLHRLLGVISKELATIPGAEPTVKQVMAMQTDSLGEYKKALADSSVGYRLILEILLMNDSQSGYIDRVSEYINYLAKVFGISFRCCDEIIDIYKKVRVGQGQDVFTTQHIPLKIAEKILDEFCKQYFIYNSERLVFVSREKFVLTSARKREFFQRKILHFKNVVFNGGDSFDIENCDQVIIENCEFRDITVASTLLAVRSVKRLVLINCLFSGIKKPPTVGGTWLLTLGRVEEAVLSDCTVENSMFGIKEGIIMLETRKIPLKLNNCKADHGYKFDVG